MKFHSVQHAADFILQNRDHPDSAKAWDYIWQNAPPGFKEQIQEGFKRFFPDLMPDYYDEQHGPCFSAERLAEAFGMSREEVVSIASEVDGIVKPQDPKPIN